MQPAELEKFNQAVALAQAGRKQEARSLLAELLRTYPNDPNVLLWFAFTTDDLNQSRLALEKVRALDPANPALPGAESWLAQQQAAMAPASVDFLLSSTAKPEPQTETPNDGYEYKTGNFSQSQGSYQGQGYGQYNGSEAGYYQQSYRPTVMYQQERPDFFGRIGLGWQFMSQAIGMARENPGLIMPSLYALGANVLIGLLLELPLAFAYSSSRSNRNDILIYIALFLVLLLNYLVTYFFSAVTIHLVHQYITTGQGDKKLAWAAANNNGMAILMVAAVSALIATIRSAVRTQRRGLGRWIANLIIGFIEGIWTTATFFILPAIVLEDRKMGDAVGRATYIMKSNLLQLGVGYVGIAFISRLVGFITMLTALGLAFLIFITLAKASILAALILAGLVIVVTLALTTAFQSYLKIAYYTCLFKWAADTEKLGSYAQAPAPLHAVLASRVYSY
jgi:hypothetical protein